MAYWFNPIKNIAVTKLLLSIKISVRSQSTVGIAGGTATVTVSATAIGFQRSLLVNIPNVGIGQSVIVNVGEVALPTAPAEKAGQTIDFTATLSGEVTDTAGIKRTLVTKVPAKQPLVVKVPELIAEVEVVVE
jgi:hypothetical protein